MSSHHIVREDQEPALLIAESNTVPFEILQQLLEWSPTVLVTEKALPQVLTWGIKIDVVIASVDHIPKLIQVLHDQFPLKLISFQGEDDALATALYFLMATKQNAVNIISLDRLETFESFAGLNLTVLQSGKRWSFIRSGIFEKWLPAGRTLHVFPQVEAAINTTQDGQLVIRKENGFWVAEE
jgi:thiamine pyrophosphokinase